ncbi:thioredoxin [bacterium]|nr:thioredoxin [candidate division CSSED10-310 bacterium]
MDSVVDIKPGNFDSEVVKASGLVIIDFTASWCGPCKRIAPILHDLAAEYAGRIKVTKVDVDENRDLAVQFRVASIPTIVFMKDGVEIKRFIGLRSKFQIKSDIDQALS